MCGRRVGKCNHLAAILFALVAVLLVTGLHNM